MTDSTAVAGSVVAQMAAKDWITLGAAVLAGDVHVPRAHAAGVGTAYISGGGREEVGLTRVIELQADSSPLSITVTQQLSSPRCVQTLRGRQEESF